MAETHKGAITGSPGNFSFDPNSLTIKAGDTVEWTNQMTVDHTVTPDKGEFPSSGDIDPQATFSHTFSATGSVAYHCQIHPRMKGTVIVT
jgi:plastocyanin